MHDALGVHVVERGRERSQHLHHPARAERAAAEGVRQRLPLDVLHDDEHAFLVGLRVEDGHEPRVAEGGSQPGLAAQPAGDVLRAVRVHALDRDLAAEALVLGQEDRRHPARAEPPEDPVAVGKPCACRPGGHG